MTLVIRELGMDKMDKMVEHCARIREAKCLPVGELEHEFLWEDAGKHAPNTICIKLQGLYLRGVDRQVWPSAADKNKDKDKDIR